MPKQSTRRPVRHLIVILGDQLDQHSAAFEGIDPKQDIILMAEVVEESCKVPVSLPRIAAFLSGMRHFREALRGEGFEVDYRELSDGETTLAAALTNALQRHQPTKVVIVEPGEWSIRESLRAVVAAHGTPLDERADSHFLCSPIEFAEHARGRKQLRMEFFYREMRRKHHVLLDQEGKPEGGDWNYDVENRGSFGKSGPIDIPPPVRFKPDSLTSQLIEELKRVFPDHVGKLDSFDWPVTRRDALCALKDFVDHRLSKFGEYQDAMWSGEPWLFHSRLSAALNLKLLRPLEVIERAQQAWQQGQAPLAAVEGFIRQILGWREFVRGIYWHFMPGYIEKNALEASRELPGFYWNGKTDMACLRDAIGQTLRLGYAHHIQRLMVTGLYALLAGVRPRAVHEWYLAMYVDAVEWVELPNTLGMSQHGDGGIMASKPYIASGKYLQRMGNFCEGCRYDPGQWQGPRACPFSLLYRDFLRRHRSRFEKHPRLRMQVRHLDGLSEAQLKQLELDAEALLQSQL